MKLSLKKTEILGFIAACVMGTLFHFVYEWSGNNPVAGLFFPVNESVWEHLKLIFLPIIITAIPEYCFFNIQSKCFVCTKLASALLGMTATVTLFYTYTGIIGRNIDFINIIIFFISMGIAWFYSYKTLSSEKCGLIGLIPEWICFFSILCIILLFAFFSVMPPDIAIFYSP